MEQRHAEVTRIGKCGELLEGGGLLRREHARFGGLHVGHRGALERIALGGLGPQQHEPARGEPTHHIGGDPPIAQLRERQSRASCPTGRPAPAAASRSSPGVSPPLTVADPSVVSVATRIVLNDVAFRLAPGGIAAAIASPTPAR